MNAFLASAIHRETSLHGLRQTVTGWIRQHVEERRRRAAEREAIEHLSKLEPYLLRDAGIDPNRFHAALASIAKAHPAPVMSR